MQERMGAKVDKGVARRYDLNLPASPRCPACLWRECYVIGVTGIGSQVSLLRCALCRFEWHEILMFRYRCGPVKAPAEPVT